MSVSVLCTLVQYLSFCSPPLCILLAVTSEARLGFKLGDADKRVTVCTESTKCSVLKVQAEIRIDRRLLVATNHNFLIKVKFPASLLCLNEDLKDLATE